MESRYEIAYVLGAGGTYLVGRFVPQLNGIAPMFIGGFVGIALAAATK